MDLIYRQQCGFVKERLGKYGAHSVGVRTEFFVSYLTLFSFVFFLSLSLLPVSCCFAQNKMKKITNDVFMLKEGFGRQMYRDMFLR